MPPGQGMPGADTVAQGTVRPEIKFLFFFQRPRRSMTRKTVDEKKSIDLSSVVETSFLISGFPNSTTFKNSIQSMVHAQNQSSNSQDLSSEIDSELTVTNKNVLDVDSERVYDEKDNFSVTSNSSYTIPNSDPLRELLGRDPIRSSPGLIKEEPRKSILKRLPGNLLRSGK